MLIISEPQVSEAWEPVNQRKLFLILWNLYNWTENYCCFCPYGRDGGEVTPSSLWHPSRVGDTSTTWIITHLAPPRRHIQLKKCCGHEWHCLPTKVLPRFFCDFLYCLSYPTLLKHMGHPCNIENCKLILWFPLAMTGTTHTHTHIYKHILLKLACNKKTHGSDIKM